MSVAELALCCVCAYCIQLLSRCRSWPRQSAHDPQARPRSTFNSGLSAHTALLLLLLLLLLMMMMMMVLWDVLRSLVTISLAVLLPLLPIQSVHHPPNYLRRTSVKSLGTLIHVGNAKDLTMPARNLANIFNNCGQLTHRILHTTNWLPIWKVLFIAVSTNLMKLGRGLCCF